MLRGILPRSTYRPFTTLGLLLALTAPFASSNELQELSSSHCTRLAESSEELSQPTCIPNDYLSTSPGSVQTVFSSAPPGVSLKLHESASLPVQNSTKSFWLDTPGANPLAEEGSEGELTRDADVCIIGSGITGVSTAWHLSKMLNGRREGDSSVVILEARRFCSGATGRNGGHLTRNPFLSFLHRQATYNTSEAVKSFLIEQYSTSSLVDFIHDRGIENAVDFVHEGLVTVFHTKDEEIRARKDWAAAKEAGLDAEVTWLDNADLVEHYGLNPKLNYTALSTPDAHNLWPCKLVTQLLEDSQTSSDVRISLHTNTPVTTITRNYWPFDHQTQGEDENTASSGSSWSITQHRRWKLHTPRGTIGCSYVVHATNGYASHCLLPFLAGIDESDSDSESHLTSHSKLSPADSDAARGGGRPPPEEEHPLPEPQPPHPHPSPPPSPPSRGAYGIIPTRGQVGAIRASVPPAEFKWRNAWDGGGGWEYFFPRFQDTNDVETNTTKSPLIILGGERQHSGGNLEAGVADDSSLNPRVSTALRAFLPHFFPGQFSLPAVEESDSNQAVSSNDGWEMEWTGIMAFTKDGDPLVGPVTVPDELRTIGEVNTQANYYEGQYISAGYSGHGMPRAFACAEVIAGLIKARITGEEWIQPYWLPEHYLTWARRT